MELMVRLVLFFLTLRVRPSVRKKVLGEPRFPSDPTGVRLGIALSVIVKLRIVHSVPVSDVFRGQKKGEVDGAIFG